MNLHYTDSWIISGWKRQGQVKQEVVRNIGLSLSLPTGQYPSISISIMKLIYSELLHHLMLHYIKDL